MPKLWFQGGQQPPGSVRLALRAGLRSAPLRCADRGRRVVFAGRAWQAWRPHMDNELQQHYALLLGIGSPWIVKTVELKMDAKQVHIELAWQWDAAPKCPVCGRACSIYDTAAPRSWRHLDTMQFETQVSARVPRANCPEHGPKTCHVPWAAPHGRFTLLFERLAVDVLLASASVQQACALLRIGWATAHDIMRRAVARGLGRREPEGLRFLGLDEKSFGRGHSYITVLTDLDGGRVLDVVEERTTAAATAVLDTLPPAQQAAVVAVAMDMWEPFAQAVRLRLPQADAVHDRFHVSKYLGEAVDKVRRKEHQEMLARGDETLKGTRQLWLYNPENFTAEQRSEFAVLKDLELKVAGAWAAKELFSRFWEYRQPGWARRFFGEWLAFVREQGHAPMVAVAAMLERHLENLLTYMKHRITNAATEGLNSKIQALKAAARGFRNFANYRTRILFFCGKLSLYPQ